MASLEDKHAITCAKVRWHPDMHSAEFTAEALRKGHRRATLTHPEVAGPAKAVASEVLAMGKLSSMKLAGEQGEADLRHMVAKPVAGEADLARAPFSKSLPGQERPFLDRSFNSE